MKGERITSFKGCGLDDAGQTLARRARADADGRACSPLTQSATNRTSCQRMAVFMAIGGMSVVRPGPTIPLTAN